MKNKFEVLKRENVSTKNQLVFDLIQSVSGAVPNLYSTLAYSENVLDAYFKLETSKTSLSAREVKAVNLVVSEVNNCMYCLSAHNMIVKQTGPYPACSYKGTHRVSSSKSTRLTFCKVGINKMFKQETQ